MQTIIIIKLDTNKIYFSGDYILECYYFILATLTHTLHALKHMK